jgi:soluble lytic murein transglycosylase-like protein
MRRRLQLVLMASPVVATFLSLTTPFLRAEAPSGSKPETITAVDESGRKIYVNEPAPPQAARRKEPPAQPRSGLFYWSASERRWKPVASASGASLRAARSAAAEVSEYLENPHSGLNIRTTPVGSRTFTQQDIDAAIDQAAARHNVDASLVRAVIKVESNFNPNAVSRKGAMGLMQLMPQTARQLNVANPFDPEQNVDAGVRHLKKLLESYGGDVKLSLAAYNAGQGAVARSSGVPHFAETQKYVRRITNLYNGGPDSAVTPLRAPVRMERDERGVLYISNTD